MASCSRAISRTFIRWLIALLVGPGGWYRQETLQEHVDGKRDHSVVHRSNEGTRKEGRQRAVVCTKEHQQELGTYDHRGRADAHQGGVHLHVQRIEPAKQEPGK